VGPAPADVSRAASPRGAAGAAGATPDQLRPAGDDRSETLDVIRGVAVLGILSMNIALFAMPFAAYQNPTVLFDYSGLNRATYWVVHTLFDTKMMSIFSMLFGAGAMLYAQKAALAEGREGERRARGLWLRRMGWLLLIGMIHAYLIWEGDILVAYALTGLMVVWWLRRLSVLWLLAAAAGFMLVSVGMTAVNGVSTFIVLAPEEAIRFGVPEDAALQMREHTDTSWFAPSEEELRAQVQTLRGDWQTVFAARAQMAAMMQTMVFVFYIFWRVAAMMLLGMALYRLGALTGGWRLRGYAVLAALGYGIGLPLVIGGILFNESKGFDPAWQSLAGMHFNELGSIPVALGHIGLIAAIVKAGALRAARQRLAAVGRMALTCYLLESVLAGLIFYGYGLGLAGRLDRFEQQLVVLGVWALLLVIAPWWLARYRFGPVEWVWRSLTYWKRQPMRRVQHDAP